VISSSKFVRFSYLNRFVLSGQYKYFINNKNCNFKWHLKEPVL
jgi:hypothetical protein